MSARDRAGSVAGDPARLQVAVPELGSRFDLCQAIALEVPAAPQLETGARSVFRESSVPGPRFCSRLPRSAVAAWLLTLGGCLGQAAAPAACNPEVPSACASSDSACLGSDAVCMPLDSARWERLGLDGQEVLALAETDWGLFAGTATAGLFRLNAATGEWTPLGLSEGLVRALLFVGDDPRRLLVGVAPDPARGDVPVNLLATEDTGKTWLPWDQGLNQPGGAKHAPHSLAVDPGNPSRVYMGTDAPILRSENGGREWYYVFASPAAFGQGVHSLLLSPARDGRIWAGGQDGVARGYVRSSTDWGDTWTALELTPGKFNSVSALALEVVRSRLWAATAQGVFRSDDGGSSWELAPGLAYAGQLLFLGDTLLAARAEAPVDPNVPGYPLGLYLSVDGTWTRIEVPDGALAGRCMIVDREGHVLIGTAGSGVWKVIF